VIFLVVFGGPILVLAIVAVWLDRRDRRGERQTSPSTWDLQNEAFHNRMDVESFHAPPVQGGSMDWATYRRRDRARNSKRRPWGSQ
jgi:hypothetical protein